MKLTTTIALGQRSLRIALTLLSAPSYDLVHLNAFLVQDEKIIEASHLNQGHMIDVETMQRKNKGEIQRRWKRWLEGEVELDSNGPEGGGFKLRVIDTARNRPIYIVRNSESTSCGLVMPGFGTF